METLDFARSYLRFYIDFEGRQAISLSHKPPTRTNRTRIQLEASCEITHRSSGRTVTTYLSAACKTEQVGAERGALWIQPNADVIFLAADSGEFAIHKSWSRCDPGVMRYPESLGPQPERQAFHADENFDAVDLDLCSVDADPLPDAKAVATAMATARPIVSRIQYDDGPYHVTIDQPVKTLNVAERDGVYQTDTGPIIVPDFSEARSESITLQVERFDLAYSAWHAHDWAEVVLNVPTPVSAELRVNHYSQTRLIEPSENLLLAL